MVFVLLAAWSLLLLFGLFFSSDQKNCSSNVWAAMRMNSAATCPKTSVFSPAAMPALLCLAVGKEVLRLPLELLRRLLPSWDGSETILSLHLAEPNRSMLGTGIFWHFRSVFVSSGVVRSSSSISSSYLLPPLPRLLAFFFFINCCLFTFFYEY